MILPDMLIQSRIRAWSVHINSRTWWSHLLHWLWLVSLCLGRCTVVIFCHPPWCMLWCSVVSCCQSCYYILFCSYIYCSLSYQGAFQDTRVFDQHCEFRKIMHECCCKFITYFWKNCIFSSYVSESCWEKHFFF